MDKLLEGLRQIRLVFLAVTETGLALVALIVTVYLLLGADSGTFVLSVMANLSLLVDAVSPQAIVAVAIVVGFISFLRSKS